MKTLSLIESTEVVSVEAVRILGAQSSGNTLSLIPEFGVYYSEEGVSDYVWKNGAVWWAYLLADNDLWFNYSAPDSDIPPQFEWGYSTTHGLGPISVQYSKAVHSPNGGTDIHLDTAGNLALATAAEGLRQKLQTRLKLYQGEWFLNSGAGVPYLQRILGRAQPSGNLVGSIAQIFDIETLKEPEVLSILNSKAEFDAGLRRYVYTAEIETVHGPMNIEEAGNG